MRPWQSIQAGTIQPGSTTAWLMPLALPSRRWPDVNRSLRRQLAPIQWPIVHVHSSFRFQDYGETLLTFLLTQKTQTRSPSVSCRNTGESTISLPTWVTQPRLSLGLTWASRSTAMVSAQRSRQLEAQLLVSLIDWSLIRRKFQCAHISI